MTQVPSFSAISIRFRGHFHRRHNETVRISLLETTEQPCRQDASIDFSIQPSSVSGTLLV